MYLYTMLEIYSNIVVLDLETTGINVYENEIIEISMLKTVNGNITERFSTLVKPNIDIPYEITKITNITNDMVKNSPTFSEISDQVKDFIGDSYILGHNVVFDLSFLSAAFNKEIPNQYIDTLGISRNLLPELEHHTLKDVAGALGVDYSGAHRSERDCEITLECFEKLKTVAIGNYIKFGVSKKPNTRTGNKRNFYHKTADAKEITRIEDTATQPDNYLFGKVCVFTGELKISRTTAMQKVVDLGGEVANGVTKKVNVLVLGDDNNLSTSKVLKAKKYQEQGIDIVIISSNEFYKYIGL